CVGVSENFVVTIDECTGIGDNGEQGSVKLFPNPVSDKLNITLSSTADVFVYSISGQLLLQQKEISGTYQMDVSGLENGSYIVKVIGKNESFTARINVIK
ncbi:MAG TPA: T9SS type A sorting domain-containing protein, partial [Bacteroidales bacterium]